ncbi:MAG: glycerol-3-phosphate 1-O-acyltransferase PlsY [Alphaproteobacteria bacterium]|jgi:acyl phosphate:glycerol-3-phosphate acyltransferase|nr:glycerol-3-phosphate 1-O-acyltransferase PlsY [Alphaproteobacteria bacterium]
MPTDQLSPMLIAIAVIGGYLLGSIPFGVIATRLGGAGDVRSIGSGNIGATNVLRTGRKDLALLTLLGDGGKGGLAVFIAWSLTKTAPQGVQATLTSLAGGAAFIGHIFPVWLGFKGGKGVATFFGTLLAAAWPVGMLAGATWILMALVFRMSSLAALTAAVLAPVYVFLTDRPYPVAVLALVMAVLIFIRHKDNIGRLLKGQEPKIGGGKTAASPEDPA